MASVKRAGSERQEGGVVTRFAPSPTGSLHLGHGWSAILAHDRARATGGRIWLRIEDIDTTRSREAHVAGILDDLAWLGLGFDGPPIRQSAPDRRAAHEAALARLGGMGLLYPCFCTRADIAAAGGAPHAGEAGHYPGTCRGLDAGLVAGRIAAGVAHAIRLDCRAAAARVGPLSFVDRHLGRVAVEPERLGDVVLARRDIGVGYMLAVVVCDGLDGVSEVVRGRDLLEATHVQRLLQALLGLGEPAYCHHGLVLGEDGRRLAKRDAGMTLAAIRAAGVDGCQLAARLRQCVDDGSDFSVGSVLQGSKGLLG